MPTNINVNVYILYVRRIGNDTMYAAGQRRT